MTIWRGVRLDARSAAMMDEVARITGPYIRPSQGSYNRGGVIASAGTHDGGGAIDIAAAQLSPAQRSEVVEAMRKVGWAAWLRTPAQANWGYHIHAIAVGCSDLSRGAAAQVRDYFNGLNGLASRGRDDGPRQYVGMTWEKYQATQKPLIYGEIKKEWERLGGKDSPVGDVIGPEADGLIPGSRFNAFQHGVIVWSATTGAHAIYGEILREFRRLGSESGILGLPLGPEHDAIRDGCRAQLFQGGRVYWSPETGAHALFGEIGRAWDYDRDGLPTSGEQKAVVQDFEKTAIGWNFEKSSLFKAH